MCDKRAVLICDLVENRDGVNIQSNNLEFTSPRYFSAIMNSLKEIFTEVIHYEEPQDFINNISKHINDVVISAIWSGTNSRNRKSLIPAICESYGIEYVGADAFVQSLCQDKALTKLYCKQFDIGIPGGILVTKNDSIDLLASLNYPVIIKPNAEGSSIGISDNSIADNMNDAIKKTKAILEFYSQVLVEEYVDGVEVAICCVGKPNAISTCEVVALEIDGNMHLEHRVWGFESKKCGAAKIARKVITQQVSPHIINEAKRIFSSLGKVDYMRIDGRILEDRFYLIELTPDCSLHPDCFMFKSFSEKGLTYTDMIREILSTQISLE